MSNCAIHKLCGEIVLGKHVMIFFGGPNLVIPVCTSCGNKIENNKKFRELLYPLLEGTQEKERKELRAYISKAMELHNIPYPNNPNDYPATLQRLIEKGVL